MTKQQTLRAISLLLGWLLVASLFVTAPAEAKGTEPVTYTNRGALTQLFNGDRNSLAAVSAGTSSWRASRSSFTASALLAPLDGDTCDAEHPDTGDIEQGRIEIRQVGYDDGYENQQILAEFGMPLSAPPGYRYELAVCMSFDLYPLPMSVDWAGDPYELVLAEGAVGWFEDAREDAFEAALKDRVPGWRSWPDRNHPQIVHLDSWLYIENYFGTLRAIETSGGDGIEVMVEAIPKASEWWWQAGGSEDTFTCSLNFGRGAPYAGDDLGGHCAMKFEHSSDVIGDIDLRVRLIYDIQITTTTLNNDDANARAGQSFVQHIYDHAGQWDVHPDASVPEDYRLTVREVLSFGLDLQAADQTRPGVAGALGATPGGKQIGPSSGCWIFASVCKVAVEIGGAIINALVPDFIMSAIEGCWNVVKDTATGLVDLIGGLDPRTWNEKYEGFVNFKNELQQAHEEGVLGDLLKELGKDAAFGALHLDILDPNNTGDFDQLEWGNGLLLSEWIGAVGCELLIGYFTGKIFDKLKDLFDKVTGRGPATPDGPDVDPDAPDADPDAPDTDPDAPDTDPDAPDDDVDPDEDPDAPDDDVDPDDPDDDIDPDEDPDAPDDDPNTPCTALSPNSFPTGTKVRMADGDLREIHLIQAGDLVVAYDTDTHEWVDRVVLDQWSAVDRGHMSTVTLADGSTSVATDHHRYWVDSEAAWVSIGELQPGDILLTDDGAIPVVEVSTAPTATTVVWELSVAYNQNFTVNTGTLDVLVHNEDSEDLGWSDAADPDVYRNDWDNLTSAQRAAAINAVPPKGGLTWEQYFDSLTPNQLRTAMAGNVGGARDGIAGALRGSNGGKHEFIPVSLAVKAKLLGLSAADIHAFTIPTDDFRAIDPVTKEPFGHGNAQNDTSDQNSSAWRYHQELMTAILEADNLDDLLRAVQGVNRKWKVRDNTGKRLAYWVVRKWIRERGSCPNL